MYTQYKCIFVYICTVFYILHKIHVCFISISPDNFCSTSLLSALHILTVLSQDPDTTLLPSAENATDVTSLAWPDKRYMSNKTNILSTYASYIYLQTWSHNYSLFLCIHSLFLCTIICQILCILKSLLTLHIVNRCTLISIDYLFIESCKLFIQIYYNLYYYSFSDCILLPNIIRDIIHYTLLYMYCILYIT